MNFKFKIRMLKLEVFLWLTENWFINTVNFKFKMVLKILAPEAVFD